MSNNSNKTIIRDSENAFLVNKVAELHKVTPRYVRYILQGDRNNEEIFKTYMDLKEGQNSLVDAVKKLIPFNS